MDSATRPNHPDVENALRELTAIRADLVSGPAVLHRRLQGVHANYRDSARNLLHYLALRRHDLRPLQLRMIWIKSHIRLISCLRKMEDSMFLK